MVSDSAFHLATERGNNPAFRIGPSVSPRKAKSVICCSLLHMLYDTFNVIVLFVILLTMMINDHSAYSKRNTVSEYS